MQAVEDPQEVTLQVPLLHLVQVWRWHVVSKSVPETGSSSICGWFTTCCSTLPHMSDTGPSYQQLPTVVHYWAFGLRVLELQLLAK